VGRPESVNLEVLAAYGLAMREAQRLERRLWQLSVVHSSALKLVRRQTVEPDEIEAAFAAYDGKTLGARLRRYRNELANLALPALSEVASKRLDDALAVRNFLAHHFFERHPAEDFGSIPSCIKALPGSHGFVEGYLDNIKEPHPTAMAELAYSRDLFVDVVRSIDAWMSKLLDAMGVRP
jgi:hypothetical protein